MHHDAPMGGATFGGDAMISYFDQLSLSMNWTGVTMENMIRHYNVEKPPHLGDHYPICPMWRDYRAGVKMELEGAERMMTRKMINPFILF